MNERSKTLKSSNVALIAILASFISTNVYSQTVAAAAATTNSNPSNKGVTANTQAAYPTYNPATAVHAPTVAAPAPDAAPANTETAIPADTSKEQLQKIEAIKKKRLAQAKKRQTTLKAAKSNAETSKEMGSKVVTEIEIIQKYDPRKIRITKTLSTEEEVVAQRESRTPYPHQGASYFNFYAGLDAVWSHVKTRYKVDDTSTLTQTHNGLGITSESIGFGASIGGRHTYKKTGIFTAFELFYDQLNNHSRSPLHNAVPVTRHDVISIDNRFGAKVYLGHKLSEKTELFLSAGLAGVRYHYGNYYLVNSSTSFRDITPTGIVYAPIFGGGFTININQNWDLRTVYEIQTIKAPILPENPGYDYESKIETIRTGLVYHF